MIVFNVLNSTQVFLFHAGRSAEHAKTKIQGQFALFGMTGPTRLRRIEGFNPQRSVPWSLSQRSDSKMIVDQRRAFGDTDCSTQNSIGLATVEATRLLALFWDTGRFGR